MRVLGVIPARGGSKGVPRKNVRLLCGKPLLAYTAEAASAARRLTRTILTTEDAEIAEIGQWLGLDVPFLRPAELARDETPMLPVVQHAALWLEMRGERYDAVCLLQPTNPLRRAEDIDGCVDLLARRGVDSVVTTLAVPAELNPHWTYLEDAEGLLVPSTGAADPIPRRQDLPPAWHREGSVYVCWRDVLVERNSLYGRRIAGYPIDGSRSVNVDDFDDWERAARLLAETTVCAE